MIYMLLAVVVLSYNILDSSMVKVGLLNDDVQPSKWQVLEIRAPSALEEAQVWNYAKGMLLGTDAGAEVHKDVQKAPGGPIRVVGDITRMGWILSAQTPSPRISSEYGYRIAKLGEPTPLPAQPVSLPPPLAPNQRCRHGHCGSME